MDMIPLFLLAVVGLDLFVGDPPRWPHPVRLIGAALVRLEPLASGLSPGGRRVFGLGVAITLPLAVATMVYLLQRLPGVGWLLGLYFGFAGLALGQLLREARSVAALADAGKLDEARLAVSYLVSRDTTDFDFSTIRRTLAETISENFNDAFVAPLFFLMLGGPPLLWFYKTISTMDSMWGYKTVRFNDIGWAGARADDLLAWIPARVSAFALIAAGFCMGLHARSAVVNVGDDAKKMASPNAGWPMAACAWLVDAPMGGMATYFGTQVQKPAMGPISGDWTLGRIHVLLRLVLVTGVGLALTAQSVYFGMH